MPAKISIYHFSSLFYTIHPITNYIIYFPRIKNSPVWVSLVAQGYGIRLPRQGTQVQSLILEDPTGFEATKPMYHNY